MSISIKSRCVQTHLSEINATKFSRLRFLTTGDPHSSKYSDNSHSLLEAPNEELQQLKKLGKLKFTIKRAELATYLQSFFSLLVNLNIIGRKEMCVRPQT